MFVTPYTKKQKFKRLVFNIVWTLFVRPFPRAVMRRLNIFVLRLFGAKIDKSANVYSSASISMPENLVMEAGSCLADHTIIASDALVHLKEGAIVSQYSYLCTSTHDIRNEDFPQFSKPITIGKGAWVAARCFIGPGVTIGDNAVVGATSSVFKDVPENAVVGGNPAIFINKRF